MEEEVETVIPEPKDDLFRWYMQGYPRAPLFSEPKAVDAFQGSGELLRKLQKILVDAETNSNYLVG